LSLILVVYFLELTVKDKVYIEILKTAITCTRRAPPANMPMQQLMALFSKYTFHIDAAVRFEAYQCMLGILTTRPSLRSIIVAEYGRFALSIPELDMRQARKALSVLLAFLQVWYDPGVLQRVDPDVDELEGLAERSMAFPANILEGVALLFLCNPSVEIR
jgi:hypothetical protein